MWFIEIYPVWFVTGGNKQRFDFDYNYWEKLYMYSAVTTVSYLYAKYVFYTRFHTSFSKF